VHGRRVLASLVARRHGRGGRPGGPLPAAPFDRAMVVVLENKSADEVLGSPASAPTFARLAHRYAVLSGYGGIAHPSLPNYVALVSGSTHGIHSDCDDCLVSARNLADTLEARGKSWKTYAEGLPSRGYTGGPRGALHQAPQPVRLLP